MRPRNGSAVPLANYWRVPKLWEGETAFVVGGGPSLRGADLSPIHDKHVIGVNAAFRLGAWVDVCWFGDATWFDANSADLREWPGLKASCHERLRKVSWVKVLKRGKPNGVETAPATVAWNSNSGASAINLAVHFGAKKVVLLGFDMQTVNGKHNWHDYHEKQRGRLSAPPETIYARGFLPRMVHVARDLEKLGVECLNACPESAMECFRKVTLEEGLRE